MDSYLVLLRVGFTIAVPVTSHAVRSYRTFSPFPRKAKTLQGSLFSVALFVGFPRPGITRHRFFVKPGLSSRLRERPPSHPARLLYHTARFGRNQSPSRKARNRAQVFSPT